MKVLLVTCEQSDDRVGGLSDAVEHLGDRRHQFGPMWFVESELSPLQAFEELTALRPEWGRFLILDVTDDNYYGSLSSSTWKWLDEHMLS